MALNRLSNLFGLNKHENFDCQFQYFVADFGMIDFLNLFILSRVLNRFN
jgi:hypothetical protein